MDVRDLFFWSAEAKWKRLERRLEAATAALLPHQESESRQQYLESLRREMTEAQHDVSEVEKLDEENARLIAEAEKFMERKRARIKARREAGLPPKKVGPAKSKRVKVLK